MGFPGEICNIVYKEAFEDGVVKVVVFQHSDQLHVETPGLPGLLFASRQTAREGLSLYLVDKILSFEIGRNLSLLAAVKFIVRLVVLGNGFHFRGIRIKLPVPYWRHFKDLKALLRLSAFYGAPFRYVHGDENYEIWRQETWYRRVIDSKFTIHFPETYYPHFLGPFKHALDLACVAYLDQTPGWTVFDWTLFDPAYNQLVRATRTTPKPGDFGSVLMARQPHDNIIWADSHLSGWLGPDYTIYPSRDLAMQALPGQPPAPLDRRYAHWVEAWLLTLKRVIIERLQYFLALRNGFGQYRNLLM